MKNKPGSDLLPEGVYNAHIMSAADKISSKNNPMLELVLAVYDVEGNDVPVTDYLTNTPKMQWKLRHLCESAGVVYERDELPAADFIGRPVRVEISKDKNDKFGWQNRVTDYVKRDPAAEIITTTSGPDDDIPF